jgi:hypothetical protein
MKTFALSVVAVGVLLVGVAYGQVALPMQAVQANRVVVRVNADQWKDVSFQANNATFENGGMRLTGNVRVSVQGHQMTADTAIISPDLLTLEGNAKVQPPDAR